MPIILGFILFTNLSKHKFYVSVTDVMHKEETGEVQVISRLFVDDFQLLLQTRYDKSLRLTSGELDEKTQTFIQKYFDQKFRLRFNGRPQNLNYIGSKFEDDRIVCFFEGKFEGTINDIKVKNTLLIDLYETQKNLFHFTRNGNINSLLLVKEKPEGRIQI